MKSYVLRLFATIAVTIGGVFVLFRFAFAAAPNAIIAVAALLLLVSLIRVAGDALNPDVANPPTLRGYLRRYVQVLFALAVQLAFLALVFPALAVMLATIFGALLALVFGVGVILWALQSWFGLEIGRALPAEEGRQLVLLCLAAAATTGIGVGLIALGGRWKDRVLDGLAWAVETAWTRLGSEREG